MPAPKVPPELTHRPFRGSDAVRRGLLTRRQLRSSAWWRPLRDIYVWTGLGSDALIRAAAIALVLPTEGVVSGLTAAWLYGVCLHAPDSLEATVPRGAGARSRKNLRVRRSNIPPGHRTTIGGIAVTTPVRTAFDLARRLPLVEAVVYVEEFVRRNLIRLSDFQSFPARGPGAAQLRRVIGLVDTRSESPMETRLRVLLVRAGLSCPVVQFSVCDTKGRFVARVDLAYPELQIAIEYDGDHHRDRHTHARDTQRQNELVRLGWTVLRFTARDLYQRPDWVVQMVRDAVAHAA